MDDSLKWTTRFVFPPWTKSLAIDSTETNVYVLIKRGPADVLRLDSSTGSLISTFQL